MSAEGTRELDREVAAFEGLKKELLIAHGSGWVLMVHQKFVRVFPDFSDAARYADEHFHGESVLIRHTETVQDSAPFLAVCH